MSGSEEDHVLGEYLDEDEEQEPGEEENVEEAEPEDEDLALSDELIGEGLSLLCKTGDGLEHAFIKFEAKEKVLTNIVLLSNFIHVRFVDVSKNNLRDISAVNALTHLLVLKADENKLTTAALEQLPYLQIASFNNNRIKSTKGINHPMLEHLSLNFNEITEVTDLDAACLTCLHTLELRQNKLTTSNGIYLINLKNLFLAANELTVVTGLDRLENIATLHLRGNQIESLDGFSEKMFNLQYINLRGNQIADIKEMEKLQVLPLIRAIVLDENPVAEEDDYRLESLIALRRLERLDKEQFTDEERLEAEDVYEQRRQEEILAQEGMEEVIPSDEDS